MLKNEIKVRNTDYLRYNNSMKKPFNVLHTSDWHLGKMLYNQRRDEEFSQFLDFLLLKLKEEEINVLLISGDIFDTTTPSNASLALYHGFLAKAQLIVDNIVIIAGNHDSPSLLASSKEILNYLNIYVITSANTDNEILLLKNKRNEVVCCVVAVPFLRERDLRLIDESEHLEDREENFAKAIETHFNLLDKKVKEMHLGSIPVIGMAHLFAAGSAVVENDGVSRLRVGTLSQIEATKLLHSVSYMALGHIHVPQTVNKVDSIRYSGSPLAMGFGECKDTKSVIKLSYVEDKLDNLTVLPIPQFVNMRQIKGSLAEILKQGEELENKKVYLEVVYTGTKRVETLNTEVEAVLKDKNEVNLLAIKAPNIVYENAILESDTALDKLDVTDVFKLRLKDSAFEEAEKKSLEEAFESVLNSLEIEE